MSRTLTPLTLVKPPRARWSDPPVVRKLRRLIALYPHSGHVHAVERLLEELIRIAEHKRVGLR